MTAPVAAEAAGAVTGAEAAGAGATGAGAGAGGAGAGATGAGRAGAGGGAARRVAGGAARRVGGRAGSTGLGLTAGRATRRGGGKGAGSRGPAPARRRRATIPGRRVLVAEFVVALLITSLSPLTDKHKTDTAGQLMKRLTGVCALWLVLGLVATGGRGPSRVASWFGGLVLLALLVSDRDVFVAIAQQLSSAQMGPAGPVGTATGGAVAGLGGSAVGGATGGATGGLGGSAVGGATGGAIGGLGGSAVGGAAGAALGAVTGAF